MTRRVFGLQRRGWALAALACAMALPGCARLLDRNARPARVGVYCDAWPDATTRDSLREAATARRAAALLRLRASGDRIEWERLAADTAISPEWTRRDLPGAGYSIACGPLHVTVIEAAAPLAPDSAAYRRVLEDLSLTPRPWKVVVLPEPIFQPTGERVARERLPLADLFERQRVALVLSPGGAGYFRSLPIGPHEAEAVRYALLGGPGARPASPPAWTARIEAGPCSAMIEARRDRLRWSVRRLDGSLVDLLEMRSGEHLDAVRFFSIAEVLVGEEPPQE